MLEQGVRSLPASTACSMRRCRSIPSDVASDLTGYPPEHEDLARALRSALLPEDSQVPGFEGLVLRELAAANEGSVLADQGLQPGDHIGPYESPNSP